MAAALQQSTSTETMLTNSCKGLNLRQQALYLGATSRTTNARVPKRTALKTLNPETRLPKRIDCLGRYRGIETSTSTAAYRVVIVMKMRRLEQQTIGPRHQCGIE